MMMMVVVYTMPAEHEHEEGVKNPSASYPIGKREALDAPMAHKAKRGEFRV